VTSAPAPRLVLIAAVARNGAIGRDNGLLWHEPLDQRHFRQLTTGCPVIMGRRTWESLPARFRPLPGRRNLVVTRSRDWQAEGAEVVHSLDEALAATASAGTGRVFVIGGGELYALALPRADELVLTEIHRDLPGDTYFPAWDRSAFIETSRDAHRAADGTAFDFVTYRRP
jgi:dihydrofolate reductase